MNLSVESEAQVSGGQIRGRSPRDGSALEPLAVTTKEGVAQAITRARAAQTQWAASSPRERGQRMKKLGKRLLERAEAFAAIMRAEQGKSDVESYTSELVPCVDLFTYWAKEAPRLLVPEARSLNPVNFPSKAGELSLVPRGVIGLIAPWNYPVSLPLRTLVPALMAGNAVVFKPSEYASRIGREIVTLFSELGVENLVQGVYGGPETGAQLIAEGVDHVVFTGSVASGKKVALACAERLVGCALELGGKDPALVLADADLERASSGIVWGAFANAGQNCAAVERVYVVESVAQRFVELVIEKTRALKVGQKDSTTWDVGPLVRPAGLATVQQHVESALKAGATLRVGGKATGFGLHYEPTVLTDVKDDMAVMAEETFGPVLPVAVVKDEAEAVRRANDSEYGLTASVWTRDLERGKRLAQELHAGVVTINNHAFTAALPHAPWHGTGHSGGGVTNSRFAFYDMCEPRYVLVDRSKQKELWWFPHNDTMAQLAKALTKLLRGQIGVVLSVLGLMRKRWK